MNSLRQASLFKDGFPTLKSPLPETCLPDCFYSSDVVLPEVLLQSPCQQFYSDQTLEDAFARLTFSPYNHPPLYQPFDFIELNTPGPLLNSAAKEFTFSGNRFPQCSNVVTLQELSWDNSSDANVGAMRSHNYWVGSDIWGLENFWSGPCPTSDVSGYSSNYDWFLADSPRFASQKETGKTFPSPLFASQKETGRTFPTVPLSNKDELCFDLLHNSRGSLNGLSRNRSNFSDFNINGRRPHWLQQPLNHLSVSDLSGRILLLAKDQYGCRLLQETMEGLNAEDISLIFLELIDHVDELMLDPFGNYVVQKLVEVCSEEQRTQIILMVTQADFQLVSICLNMHGTRAVQKLLDHVTTQQQRAIIISALSPGAVALTRDMNGHHVILHCLKHFSDEDNEYLLNEVANNCFGIATDKSGCCVLQQCVNHAHGDTKNRLMSEIVGNGLNLAEHCYGNYVVQHLISLKIPRITENLVRKLEGKFVSLSCNKYGSNVVEKFLQDSGEKYCARIILELLRNSNVSMLLVDPFGNYVIKSALLVSKGYIRNALLKLVQENSPMMRSNLYGKKLLARFDRRKVRHM